MLIDHFKKSMFYTTLTKNFFCRKKGQNTYPNFLTEKPKHILLLFSERVIEVS